MQTKYQGIKDFLKDNPLNLATIKTEKISVIIERKMILNAKIKFFNLFKNKNTCDFLFKNSYKTGKIRNWSGIANKTQKKASS